MPVGPQPPKAVSRRDGGGRPRGIEPAAAVLLALLSAIWAWWAAKQGGYFSSVWLPGVIALCGGLALFALWAPWRGELRLSRGVPIALAGLAGRAGWPRSSAASRHG